MLWYNMLWCGYSRRAISRMLHMHFQGDITVAVVLGVGVVVGVIGLRVVAKRITARVMAGVLVVMIGEEEKEEEEEDKEEEDKEEEEEEGEEGEEECVWVAWCGERQ